MNKDHYTPLDIANDEEDAAGVARDADKLAAGEAIDAAKLAEELLNGDPK